MIFKNKNNLYETLFLKLKNNSNNVKSQISYLDLIHFLEYYRIVY